MLLRGKGGRRGEQGRRGARQRLEWKGRGEEIKRGGMSRANKYSGEKRRGEEMTGEEKGRRDEQRK